MAGDFDIAPEDWEEDMSGSKNGKGDTPRPMAVDAETFSARWAETFACTCENKNECQKCRRETLGDPEE